MQLSGHLDIIADMLAVAASDHRMLECLRVVSIVATTACNAVTRRVFSSEPEDPAGVLDRSESRPFQH